MTFRKRKKGSGAEVDPCYTEAFESTRLDGRIELPSWSTGARAGAVGDTVELIEQLEVT